MAKKKRRDGTGQAPNEGSGRRTKGQRAKGQRATGSRAKGRAARQAELDFHPVRDVALRATTRRRYLNYAMSVITSRALPDVRDGLKPVQRRILYTMQHELHLAPGSKPLKCARIVGDVLGKFHPHGDTAVYDALVRMAQDFSLRYPLVDGHGNFGSLDGDPAAAYRYTEATLQRLSMELLRELPRETVDFRPNYDQKTREPIVLPAKFPSLLVNGATGIAVGMATNVPPHNLAEVTEACEALIENRDLEVKDLVKIVKGPDFPTGGEVLNSRGEIRAIYEEGQGSIRLRAQYSLESDRRAKKIIVTSIPYMIQKDILVRSIGDLVFARKVPQLVDVRDESTTDVRIVLELKSDADPHQVMAYLYKHTSLQSTFNVNLTCLVPVGSPSSDTCSPARIDLRSILLQFIDFRYAVVERRFRFDLRQLEERIHILEGFKKIFDALDETIRIIRASDGRQDAAEKLMARFRLDEIQVNAILDLRLYKLARLEIKIILEELGEKRSEAKKIGEILGSNKRLWRIVREELAAIREEYGDKRRTEIGFKGVVEEEYSEEAFILDEDAYTVLSRDGWIKRATRISDASKVRLRQGDVLQSVIAGNTKRLAVFFTNFGSAYTLRINDIPMSRGHGDPIQKLFKFKDRENVVAALSLDPRVLKDYGEKDPGADTEPRRHLLVVSSAGFVLRCSLAAFAEPSTRTGRRFAKLRSDEEIVGVHVVEDGDTAMLCTTAGRVLLFSTREASFLGGPGRGVIGIKLAKGDRVLGSGISRQPSHKLTAITTGERRVDITTRRYNVTSRGGKGFEVIKRGGLTAVEPPEIVIPDLS